MNARSATAPVRPEKQAGVRFETAATFKAARAHIVLHPVGRLICLHCAEVSDGDRFDAPGSPQTEEFLDILVDFARDHESCPLPQRQARPAFNLLFDDHLARAMDRLVPEDDE